MFDRDQWREIASVLWRNKWRSFLTALGVGWGIFMLIVMLGATKGLENGTKRNFNHFASNSVHIWTMSTSRAYKGFPKGRNFDMNNDDMQAIKDNIPEVTVVCPRAQLGGYRGANNVVRNNKTGAFSINGDYPEIQQIQLFRVTNGRSINHLDIDQKRKVCVIGEAVRGILFKDGEEPIGDYIQINGIYFKVVGVFRSGKSGDAAERDENTIYIPFTTYQKAFNNPNRVGWFSLLITEDAEGAVVEEKLRKLLGDRHSIHPEDPRAFGSFNAGDEFKDMNLLFLAMTILGWFLGILTLLAGVIGISNIMLFTVKERTRELGVRRALGATPGKIRLQIVLEAITLTFLAGITGFLVAVGIIELLASTGVSGDFFTNPEINFRVALIAITALTVFGALAGMIPAWRATSIKPVDALRAE